MEQNIYGRIITAAADFESMTGTKPTFVYLGFNEWRELAEFLFSMYQFRMAPANNKLENMEFLYVPKKNHLGVGV